MNNKDLPVACSLTNVELLERRRSVLQQMKSVVSEIKETHHGYVYGFSSNGVSLTDLASFVELEHQCCPFLKFSITVEPGEGSIWLEMSGPIGTKEFLAKVFN